MDEITIEVRGRKSIFDPNESTTDIQVYVDGVILRLEDPENAKFWTEISISKDLLQKWLEEITDIKSEC